MRWRTFTEQVVGVAKPLRHPSGGDLRRPAGRGPPHPPGLGVRHGRRHAALGDEMGLLPSRYEGPTGITGVLQAACRDAGLRSVALWAAVPTYVPSAPSPKAALALTERAAQLLDLSVVTTELEIASASYERQVSELVSDDTETIEYVEHLEQPLRQQRAGPLRRRRGEPGGRGRALPARSARLTRRAVDARPVRTRGEAGRGGARVGPARTTGPGAAPHRRRGGDP